MKFLGHCPVCKLDFTEDKALLMERRERFSVFHATCIRCESSVLIFLDEIGGITGRTDKKEQQGRDGRLVTAYGLLTDLSSEDFLRIRNKRRLKKADIPALRSYYKNI